MFRFHTFNSSSLEEYKNFSLGHSMQSCNFWFKYWFLSSCTDPKSINRPSLLYKRGLYSSQGRLTSKEIMTAYYVYFNCVHWLMNTVKNLISTVINTSRVMEVLQSTMVIKSVFQCYSYQLRLSNNNNTHVIHFRIMSWNAGSYRGKRGVASFLRKSGCGGF
jgi:hypothetical protein